MRRPALLAGLPILAGALLAAWAASGGSGAEGVPSYGLTAWFLQSPRLGATGLLRVAMSAETDSSAVGEVHIILPHGIVLVKGDTTRRSSPTGPDAEWTIELKATEIGRKEIVGRLSISSAYSGIDETEFLLPLVVAPESTIVGGAQPVRYEHLRGGQRYRYGGMYLVPIDSSEAIVQGDIDPRNGRAQVVERADAIDETGVLRDVVRVPVMVIVGKDGHVVESRALGSVARNKQAVSGALRALEKWRFTPAKAKGRPVNDWLQIEIVVAPGK